MANPPTFEPRAIQLQSITDSQIVAVNLYSTRAEVTRLYKLEVQVGHNQVQISGLPNVLEPESLRVEGRGAATIHDVSVARKRESVSTKSSPKLFELTEKRAAHEEALKRVKFSVDTLRQYMSSLTVQDLPVSQLDDVLIQCEATGARLDKKITEITDEISCIARDIDVERALITAPREDEKLRMTATVGVFAQEAGQVEIALIYAVPTATWTAFYDIRVDRNTKENPVKLIYKAAITQNTGEPWENVPLQLETSTPTFGLGVPVLSPWNLAIQHPRPRPAVVGSSFSGFSTPPPAPTTRMRGAPPGRSADEPLPNAMAVASASVTSKGNVNATFRVPGLVTIPCDGQAHNFTIVELELMAAMSWVSVPKLDPRTHLSARITNASEYTLLAGSASVYVDGSFISRSPVPAVSPQESFDCPLGLDPSVRITYHPVLKTRSQSGFYTKSATHVFTQRITVHNTKAVPLGRLKVVDQVPTSQDAQIEVKLVNPALVLPPAASGDSVKSKTQPPQIQPLSLGNGVVAQWDGVDEPSCDVDTLGLDRKLNWVCTVPAQAKINLSLEWEVTVSPASAQVIGL